jgi:hypothetical protein
MEKFLVIPDWISVEDRLPQEGDLVLTFHSSGQWSEYKLDYMVELVQGKMWAKTKEEEWHRISHWMPLPRSPGSSIERGMAYEGDDE